MGPSALGDRLLRARRGEGKHALGLHGVRVRARAGELATAKWVEMGPSALGDLGRAIIEQILIKVAICPRLRGSRAGPRGAHEIVGHIVSLACLGFCVPICGKEGIFRAIVVNLLPRGFVPHALVPRATTTARFPAEPIYQHLGFAKPPVAESCAVWV